VSFSGDGDTLTVLDVDKVQHKIRLAGIDVPEEKQHSAPLEFRHKK